MLCPMLWPCVAAQHHCSYTMAKSLYTTLRVVLFLCLKLSVRGWQASLPGFTSVSLFSFRCRGNGCTAKKHRHTKTHTEARMHLYAGARQIQMFDTHRYTHKDRHTIMQSNMSHLSAMPLPAACAPTPSYTFIHTIHRCTHQYKHPLIQQKYMSHLSAFNYLLSGPPHCLHININTNTHNNAEPRPTTVPVLTCCLRPHTSYK